MQRYDPNHVNAENARLQTEEAAVLAHEKIKQLEREIGTMTSTILDLLIATANSPVYQDWMINGGRWDEAERRLADKLGRKPHYKELLLGVAEDWVAHATFIRQQTAEEVRRICDDS